MIAYSSYGFETILNPRSCCPYTGKESVEVLGNNVNLYKDQFGSERYVLYENGRSVSALQLMIENDKARVANVITVKNKRQKGYARMVWNEAKKKHPFITHSHNLSEDGKIFAERCN